MQTAKALVYILIDQEPALVGELRLENTGFLFGYDDTWLNRPDAFSLDPLNLPLGHERYRSRHCWGAFLDAGPDRWGQQLWQAMGKSLPANPLEWLVATSGNGVGALTLSSPDKVPAFSCAESAGSESLIPSLLKAVRWVDEGGQGLGEDCTPEVRQALLYGVAMGGARPKFVIRSQGREWLCKPARTSDAFNHSAAELACLNMAEDCGITVPAKRLITVDGWPVLMIERFDRTLSDGASRQRHYLSAHALVNPQRVRENDPESPLSYLRLADLIAKVSADPVNEPRELFVRMLLNMMVGNTDDHLRNHGFLHEGGEQYRLSPAFDIVPQSEPSQMALVMGSHGREASLENALSQSHRFGLSEQDAKEALSMVMSVTQNAEIYYHSAGVDSGDASELAGIIRHRI